MLTKKNIAAINEFIERWNAGEREFTGSHAAAERLLASGLKRLGVELSIKQAHRVITEEMREKGRQAIKAKFARMSAEEKAAAMAPLKAAKRRYWNSLSPEQKSAHAAMMRAAKTAKQTATA